MRRATLRWMILLTATGVLLLATMTAASADPPCDKNPDHASCATTTTQPGTTTTTTVPAAEATCAGASHRVVEATNGFTVHLGPRESVCVDWTTTVESFWAVSFEPATAGSVFMKLTDTLYAPVEDRCWHAFLDKGTTITTIYHMAVFHGDDGPLPASGTGACAGTQDTDAAYLLLVVPSGKPVPLTVTVTPTATPPD